MLFNWWPGRHIYVASSLLSGAFHTLTIVSHHTVKSSMDFCVCIPVSVIVHGHAPPPPYSCCVEAWDLWGNLFLKHCSLDRWSWSYCCWLGIPRDHPWKLPSKFTIKVAFCLSTWSFCTPPPTTTQLRYLCTFTYSNLNFTLILRCQGLHCILWTGYTNWWWFHFLSIVLYRQNILQFVTKYGSIVSFKFLFRSGAERSEQRDYCFVEYSTREVGVCDCVCVCLCVCVGTSSMFH